MRTNVVLDDQLVAEACRLTGIRTKREVIDQALRLLVESKRRKGLFELEGKIRFSPGYDYKALRR